MEAVLAELKKETEIMTDLEVRLNVSRTKIRCLHSRIRKLTRNGFYERWPQEPKDSDESDADDEVMPERQEVEEVVGEKSEVPERQGVVGDESEKAERPGTMMPPGTPPASRCSIPK